MGSLFRWSGGARAAWVSLSLSFSILILGSFGAAAFASSAEPEDAISPLEEVALVTTDSADRRAVVRVGDRKLQLLAPGDAIEGTGAIVEQVLADRLVVIETAGEPRRRRLAWIYLRDRAEGVPHVRYIEGRAPARESAASPSAADPAQEPSGSGDG